MLIETKGISKSYPNGNYGKNKKVIISDVNIEIEKGESVGLFGDSGSGKSTIGQIIVGIVKPTSGEVYLNGQRLKFPLKNQDRRKIQILFQHPETSFNPKLKLIKSLKEVYTFYKIPFSIERLCNHLKQYGIYEDHINRFPSELSGGELQRIALARIMIINPDFIVLDEPTSMLDAISQAQIIHMLREIQKIKGISYLFISHDKLLCDIFSDKIYYIKDGKCFL